MKNRSTVVLVIILFLNTYLPIFSGGPGWVAGDFHQHTTFTDGSYSFYYIMSMNNKFGLDWWANSEHGGGFTLNGFTSGDDLGRVSNYWDEYDYKILGEEEFSRDHRKMWRWQALRDVVFNGIISARNLYPDRVIIQGFEWNAPGHEHVSVSCIDGQFSPNPNCAALAEFEYKFDARDDDEDGGEAQGWKKSDESGHDKTIEAVKWLQNKYPKASWVVPAHPERKDEWDIEAFREMNNAAPDVCFGFEAMPGHQKKHSRGNFNESNGAVGDCTYGGAGIYAAKIGGLWDAMLSEERHWWVFASSDFHNTTGGFSPGEYQKTYTYVNDTENAQAIVDGMRSGASWIVTGDLIDYLEFKIEEVGMGGKLTIDSGRNVKIYIKVHDPDVNNNNTFSDYKNPMLDHLDIIAGEFGDKIDPDDGDYDEINAKNVSVCARFDSHGGGISGNGIKSSKWTSCGSGWIEISFEYYIKKNTYFRLRGTNHGLNVKNETDANGNPLPDDLLYPNDAAKAYADLWFYSNPIFVEMNK